MIQLEVCSATVNRNLPETFDIGSFLVYSTHVKPFLIAKTQDADVAIDAAVIASLKREEPILVCHSGFDDMHIITSDGRPVELPIDMSTKVCDYFAGMFDIVSNGHSISSSDIVEISQDIVDDQRRLLSAQALEESDVSDLRGWTIISPTEVYVKSSTTKGNKEIIVVFNSPYSLDIKEIKIV